MNRWRHSWTAEKDLYKCDILHDIKLHNSVNAFPLKKKKTIIYLKR